MSVAQKGLLAAVLLALFLVAVPALAQRAGRGDIALPAGAEATPVPGNEEGRQMALPTVAVQPPMLSSKLQPEFRLPDVDGWQSPLEDASLLQGPPSLQRHSQTDGDGLIAFVGSDGNIWTIQPDGTGQQRLTTTFSNATDPTWSPDGSKLVFSAGGASVHVINRDGSGLTQLASGLQSAWWFAWSGDGRRVVFTTSSGSSFHTYVAASDGSGSTRLAPDVPEHSTGASLSPDGQWAAIPAKDPDGRWGVYKVNVSRQQGTWLPGRFYCTFNTCVCPPTPYTYFSRWSPNGSEIAFVGVRTEEWVCGFFRTCCRAVGTLYRIPADGGVGPLPMGDLSASDNPRGHASFGNLAWSPGGSSLATHALRPDGNWHAGVAIWPAGVRWLNGRLGDIALGVGWSPDGSRLVSDMQQGGTSSVYVVDPGADSWGEPIAAGQAPDWGGDDPWEETGDRDGDGLPDEWEINGHNGLDLQAMGADPDHKDIFVEIDWMEVPCDGLFCFRSHSHRPKENAIARVVEAFARAPVDNPDRNPGIRLHVDLDTQLADIRDLTFRGFLDLRANHFTRNRRGVFHYSLFAHDLDPNLVNPPAECQSGIAWGSDFVAALGGWGGVWPESCTILGTGTGTVQQQAGTFMHELGHTLGLNHGGPEARSQVGEDGFDQTTLNYKPNYLSVMNYWFQMRGLIKGGEYGYLDYSRFAEIDILDEEHLDEQLGLQGGPAIDDYGTRWACATDSDPYRQDHTEKANEPINWDCDWHPYEPEVKVNIDKDEDDLLTELHSFDDWSDVNLGYGCIGPRNPGDRWCADDGQDLERGTGALQAQTDPPEAPRELTLSENAQIYTPYAVSVIAEESHTTSPTSRVFTVTIANTGAITDTYDVAATSPNGWADLQSAPADVTVNPQNQYQFVLTMTIPDSAVAGDSDEMTVRATSRTHPLVSDVAEVWAGVVPQLAYLPIVLTH